MTVLDTSALLAVLLGEPDAERFLDHMAGAKELAVGAPTLVEAEVVLRARLGEDAVRDLHALLADLLVDVVAFDEEMAGEAAAAWDRFGKGRHPASLNLGDTYSYAVARVLSRPLLCKGNDFRQTDLALALR